MTTTPRYHIGQTVRLPDGPTVDLVDITEGIEFGQPVYYLTGINAFGREITRWVAR